MKRFVSESPMAWPVVALVCSITAERIGPDAGVIYLVALGIAAIALAHILVPGLLRPDDRGEKGAR